MFTDTAASKVTAAHLPKPALLYVRQSTLKQVIHNTESAIRQYDLRGRAIALGWAEDQITVIDIDQGHSGASAADREGFQHLVAEVSLGRAGIVLGLECSRLARNSADWHQLLEMCGMTGTLICDEDGLYDPRDFNDRLLLGMKGQISEAELHFIRARLRGGMLSKARRGELITPLPVGLAYDAAGHVVLDPDTAVQQALRHLFDHLRRHRVGHRLREGVQRQAELPSPGGTAKGPARASWTGNRCSITPCCGCCTTPATPARSPTAGTATRNARRQDEHHQAAARGMDRLHPRRPPRLHHPGAVRGQPRPAGRQRRRARPRPRQPGHPAKDPPCCKGIIICGRCGNRMTVRYHPAAASIPDYVCQRDGIDNAEPDLRQSFPGTTSTSDRRSC